MEKLIIEGGCLQPGVDKELILFGGTDEDRLEAARFDHLLYDSKIVKELWEKYSTYREKEFEKRLEYIVKLFDLVDPAKYGVKDSGL